MKLYSLDFAYRIDPDSRDMETTGGRELPYTDSEMTGDQLATVKCPNPAG